LYSKSKNSFDPNSDQHPDSGFMSSKFLRLLIGLTVSGVCIVYLIHSVEKDKVWDALRLADKTLLVSALLVTCFGYIIRAFRWKFLFSDIKLTFASSFRAMIVGFFMNNVLPARIGEIVRAHTLSRDIGKSRTFVLATIAAERLADGVTISLIFGIFYYLSGNQLDGAREISYVAMLFLAASFCTVILLLVRKHIFSFLEYLDESFKIRGMSFLLVRIKRFIVGLEPLFTPHLLLRVVLLSCLVWGLELFAYALVAIAFDQHLTLGGLALFLAVVNFSSLIPAGPGGVGVIEAIASAALTTIGIEKEIALAMVVSQHAIQYIAVGLPGLYYTFFTTKKLPSSVEIPNMQNEFGG